MVIWGLGVIEIVFRIGPEGGRAQLIAEGKGRTQPGAQRLCIESLSEEHEENPREPWKQVTCRLRSSSGQGGVGPAEGVPAAPPESLYPNGTLKPIPSPPAWQDMDRNEARDSPSGVGSTLPSPAGSESRARLGSPLVLDSSHISSSPVPRGADLGGSS